MHVHAVSVDSSPEKPKKDLVVLGAAEDVHSVVSSLDDMHADIWKKDS